MASNKISIQKKVSMTKRSSTERGFKKNFLPQNGYQIHSFFSGLGFLDLGFEAAGFETITCNEIHKPFYETYLFARDKMGIPYTHKEFLCSFDDIKSDKAIKPQKDSGIIGYIAGPPCPDFSLAGKHKGHEGTNGRLTGIYFNTISTNKPHWFLFENVKGLWKTRKSKAYYEQIVKQLTNSGYWITAKLINCMDYGVPQERERVILIGFHRKIMNRTKGGLLKREDFNWDSHSYFNAIEVKSLKWPKTNNFGYTPIKPKFCPEELMVQHWWDENNVENHVNAAHKFTPQKGLEKIKTIREGDVSRKSFKRLHRWRYSPTAAYGNNEVHLHPFKPRRISASEALAIQSLPKEYQIPEHISLSNMFKGIGNGVPYLAAKALAHSIHEFLDVNR